MKLLTEDARLICPHPPGTVSISAGQDLVRVDGRKLLVRADPVGCDIGGCPNSVGMKACLKTLSVVKAYSSWIRIDGRPVCVDTLKGFSDGTPPGNIFWVDKPGQVLLEDKG